MPSTEDHFNEDLKDVHLVYDYDVTTPDGKSEKWRYEAWFYSFERIVYAIHGGPMKGRYNYQTAEYQCEHCWSCDILKTLVLRWSRYPSRRTMAMQLA